MMLIGNKLSKNFENSLLRILKTGEKDMLLEAMSSLEYHLGIVGVITVFDTQRKIVATTETNKEYIKQIQTNLYRLDVNIRKLCIEETTTLFRPPYSEYRIRELCYGDMLIGGILFELRDVVTGKDVFEVDRPIYKDAFTYFALISHLCILEGYHQSALSTDPVTLLLTKNELVSYIEKEMDCEEEGYAWTLIFLSISNAMDIKKKLGLSLYQDNLRRVAQSIQRMIGEEELYSVSESVLAFVFKHSLYDTRDYVANMLDNLMDTHSGVEFRVAISPIEEDIYRALYACESSVQNNSSGDVICIVRFAEQFSDKEVEEIHIPRVFREDMERGVSEGGLGVELLSDEEIEKIPFQEQENPENCEDESPPEDEYLNIFFYDKEGFNDG